MKTKKVTIKLHITEFRAQFVLQDTELFDKQFKEIQFKEKEEEEKKIRIKQVEQLKTLSTIPVSDIHSDLKAKDYQRIETEEDLELWLHYNFDCRSHIVRRDPDQSLEEGQKERHASTMTSPPFKWMSLHQKHHRFRMEKKGWTCPHRLEHLPLSVKKSLKTYTTTIHEKSKNRTPSNPAYVHNDRFLLTVNTSLLTKRITPHSYLTKYNRTEYSASPTYSRIQLDHKTKRAVIYNSDNWDDLFHLLIPQTTRWDWKPFRADTTLGCCSMPITYVIRSWDRDFKKYQKKYDLRVPSDSDEDIW